MANWQVPGMGDAMRLMQVQAEVLAQLPETIADLNRAIRGLADAVDAMKETAVAAQRVSARVERVLDAVEDPLLGLKPGIERLTSILDDPVIGRITPTLESIEQAVVPWAESAQHARVRLANLRTAPRRIVDRIRHSGGDRDPGQTSPATPPTTRGEG